MERRDGGGREGWRGETEEEGKDGEERWRRKGTMERRDGGGGRERWRGEMEEEEGSVQVVPRHTQDTLQHRLIYTRTQGLVPLHHPSLKQ
ncbi:hypothetical protein Pmani_016256 [Petrolisthes manimaculis]|uniref:Uncharacterized protein n=1 Tax=Petrolisthes manimaculis TaxID=1843537 RepID=A0AAE1U6K3_9EUCA|nr:hypothetical protein Pmani_016256 [Petrolisthes manimaculis]